MSKRLTPEEQMDQQAQKLKALGVTITVTPGNPREGFETRPAGIIEATARRNGIYGTMRKGNP